MSKPSLADLLESADPTPVYRTSATRAWIESLSERDRVAVLRWIADGKSVTCLYRTARAAGMLETITLAAFTPAVRTIRNELNGVAK